MYSHINTEKWNIDIWSRVHFPFIGARAPVLFSVVSELVFGLTQPRVANQGFSRTERNLGEPGSSVVLLF